MKRNKKNEKENESMFMIKQGQTKPKKETGWDITAVMDHITHHHAWIYVIVDRCRANNEQNVTEGINVSCGGHENKKGK